MPPSSLYSQGSGQDEGADRMQGGSRRLPAAGGTRANDGSPRRPGCATGGACVNIPFSTPSVHRVEGPGVRDNQTSKHPEALDASQLAVQPAEARPLPNGQPGRQPREVDIPKCRSCACRQCKQRPPKRAPPPKAPTPDRRFLGAAAARQRARAAVLWAHAIAQAHVLARLHPLVLRALAGGRAGGWAARVPGRPAQRSERHPRTRWHSS